MGENSAIPPRLLYTRKLIFIHNILLFGLAQVTSYCLLANTIHWNKEGERWHAEDIILVRGAPEGGSIAQTDADADPEAEFVSGHTLGLAVQPDAREVCKRPKCASA